MRMYCLHEHTYLQKNKVGERPQKKKKKKEKTNKLMTESFQANPHNYDAWFDFLRLSENEGDVETTRDVYERAISNIPLVKEKRHWRRYIYLWINYALYEELETKVILYDQYFSYVMILYRISKFVLFPKFPLSFVQN